LLDDELVLAELVVLAVLELPEDDDPLLFESSLVAISVGQVEPSGMVAVPAAMSAGIELSDCMSSLTVTNW